MENMNKCPGCSHHCDRNNLQCSKGEAYFNGEITRNTQCSQGHRDGKCCGHHEGKNHSHCEGKHHGHGHRRPEFPEGSLADLLAKCGHKLFHGGQTTMFGVLSDAEQNTLKTLLSKLLSN